MERMHLETGTILAEKYRLESVLGVGGMGTVYRAQHLALNAPVAVKVIDREVTEGDVALSRFMREAQSAASLRSPHVVQILDYGTDHDRPFMVMELLEGEPLAARIERQKRLSPEETFRVLHHVAKAVSKAHEAEIVHRDLKPDNVFLVHNEGDEVAKVLDFGVAKVEATALDGAGHTRTGSLLGTPYYMSPEQAQGNKDVDSRSDLWALGVIAFECMTGRRPFQSDGLGDLVLQICIRDIPVPSESAQVPDGFDAWFEKACAREPGDRFQTARELSEALREALGLGAAGSIPESRWVERSLPPGLSSSAQAVRDDAEASVPSTPAVAGEEAPSPPSDRAGAQDPSAASARPTQLSADERVTDTTIFDDGPPASAGRRSQWEVLPRDAPAELQTPAALDDTQPHRSGRASGTSLFFVGLGAILIGGALVFGLRSLGLELDAEDTPAPARPRTVAAPSDPNGTSEADAAAPAPAPQVAPAADAAEGNPTAADALEEDDLTQDAKAGEEGAEPKGDSPSDDAQEPVQSDSTAPGDQAGPSAADSQKGPPAEEETSLDAIDDSAQKSIEESETASPEDDGGPAPVVPDTLAPAPPPPPPAGN